jgi:hypothetical protein
MSRHHRYRCAEKRFIQIKKQEKYAPHLQLFDDHGLDFQMTGSRASVDLGNGLRVNLSSQGVGASWGIAGLRLTVRPDGRTSAVVRVPGTSLSYVLTGRPGGDAASAGTLTGAQSALNVPLVPKDYPAQAQALGDELMRQKREYLALPYKELVEAQPELEGLPTIPSLANPIWMYVLGLSAVGGVFSGEIGSFLFGLVCAVGAWFIFKTNKDKVQNARTVVTTHFDTLAAVPYAEAQHAQQAIDQDRREAHTIALDFTNGVLPQGNFRPTDLPPLILEAGEYALIFEPQVNHMSMVGTGFAPAQDGALIITNRRVVFLSGQTNQQFRFPDVLSVRVDGDGVIAITLNTRSEILAFYALGSAYRVAALVAGFAIRDRQTAAVS